MIFFFLGDSLTLGLGDETGQGWPGRIAAQLMEKGDKPTAYNLGVRKDTSIRLRHRWQNETGIRRLDDTEHRLVFSFGVADVINEIPTEESLAAAFATLTQAAKTDRVLVIGPTPVIDSDKKENIHILSNLLEAMCRQLDLPFIETVDAMDRSAVYAQALADGDSVHPTAAGYAELAAHILKTDEAQNFFGTE